MSNSFPRSMRSLAADGSGRSVAALLLGLLFLCAWSAWFLLARVTLYEVTSAARLEAVGASRSGVELQDGRAFAIVAYFPIEALGRIRPGQPARLRLHAFPWPQYGSHPLTVGRVESEPHNGRFRVRLALAPPFNTRVPLQRGLPGTVEVEVERLSPATLVLRMAGRMVGTLPPPDEGQ